MTSRTYIDVHHHFRTAEMVEAARAVSLDLGGGGRTWSPEAALDGMDATGIGAAIISPIIFVESVDSAERAVPLLQLTNDIAANVVRRWPDCFGAFAAVPICDADAAVTEIARALDVLELDGVLLASGLGHDLIGVPRFDPILAELDRRSAVVHLHPTTSPNPVPGFGSSTPLDFPIETTRAIGSLLGSGAFERYPNIRWIMAHGGGAFPYVVGRVARSDKSLHGVSPNGTASYLRAVYYDIAVCCHPNAIPSLLTVTIPDHILFGTDMPAFSEDEVRGSIRALENDFGLDDAALGSISRGTAASLFPRLLR